MDKTAVVAAVEKFHQALQARGIRRCKVVLYGSYANGAHREGSDIDLIVISDDFAGKGYWERIDVLVEAIYETAAPIEAIAMTTGEWEKGDSLVAQFARNGEVLFAA